MAALIIEGIDATGKSTLARYLAPMLGMPIQESEGPGQSAEEINARIRGYFELTPQPVFVRHPAISQPLYQQWCRKEPSWVEPDLIDILYASRPVIIYCDPTITTLENHEIKGHDTLEHLKQIEDNYQLLLSKYREWACRNATICYRIGDPMHRIARMVRAAL